MSDALIDETLPQGLRRKKPLNLPRAKSEAELLAELRELARQNRVFKSYLGQGYFGTHTPAVIQRNILENPGWYTAYTPYQAEISQGRLEALINFQTMISDLTGMEIAGASLLDEATAAAEAMTLCWRTRPRGSSATTFLVDQACHPQVIDVVRTRAEPLGIRVVVVSAVGSTMDSSVFGVLITYPDTWGRIVDPSDVIAGARAVGAKVVFSADLLALTLLKSPGEWGADVVVGSSQRFGVPLGYGGPHAGFLATKESLKRDLPGRLVGVSKDSRGEPAYRLALQTREQHIRRESATSNICTAQVLLAVMASMYAVYHGPEGLKGIAQRVHDRTVTLAQCLVSAGYQLASDQFFDTLVVVSGPRSADQLVAAALAEGINVRPLGDRVLISLDETVTEADLNALLRAFGLTSGPVTGRNLGHEWPALFDRTTSFLSHPVFHQYHTETEMMRYLNRLQSKDYSLVHGMIPLGSCTMKVNPAAAMFPITWPEFAQIHPHVPDDQVAGYHELFRRLQAQLSEITELPGISLQPNSGAQGEYAGLLAIRGWHLSRGQGHRTICLIPTSAHGTNPASATLAGMHVVTVRCDEGGNVDVTDLQARIDEHRENLAALMITYPSTHGVFEASIVDMAQRIHEAGGQVYMDGANLNAQVGLTSPGTLGADVCHLNLHKTFSIPHGGGGPGVGPIAVAQHLIPFLPPRSGIGMVSASAWGSAGVLPIPYVAIGLLGAEGLTEATRQAIRNANFIADRLHSAYPVLYRGTLGRVAHECILDLRPLKATSGVEAEDVAKRLMDYGFHAPTLSFPVPGTLMVEPTESESPAELDRFCDAMLRIRQEIRDIEEGRADRERNLLKDAPFPVELVAGDVWDRPYTRQQAAWPAPWLKDRKFWPSVGRIENVWGDRNLFCSCVPIAANG